MKRVLFALMSIVVLLTTGANAITKEQLKRYDVLGLLPLYYGDLDPAYYRPIENNANALLVREELISRPNLTEVLMNEFRGGGKDGTLFGYAILAIGEFGNPSEVDQRLVLSVIKGVRAKEIQSRSTNVHLDSRDQMVVMAMGAYLAGRRSADGEAILLSILSDPDWNYGLAYTLRMVEKYPTRARLKALRSRGSTPTASRVGQVYQPATKHWVDASVVKVEASLREVKETQQLSFPEPGARPAVAPDATPTEDQRQERPADKGHSPANSSGRERTFWLLGGIIALLLIIGAFAWKRHM